MLVRWLSSSSETSEPGSRWYNSVKCWRPENPGTGDVSPGDQRPKSLEFWYPREEEYLVSRGVREREKKRNCIFSVKCFCSFWTSSWLDDVHRGWISPTQPTNAHTSVLWKHSTLTDTPRLYQFSRYSLIQLSRHLKLIITMVKSMDKGAGLPRFPALPVISHVTMNKLFDLSLHQYSPYLKWGQ